MPETLSRTARLSLAPRGWRLPKPKPGRLALLQAVAIGLLAGLLSVLFRWSMGAIGVWRNRLGLYPHHLHEWFILPLLGCVGGLIAGYLTIYLAPDAKGSGIPQVKHALADAGQRLRLRTVGVKFIGAVVGIGAGLSLGREGPTVQIGSSIGEWIHKWSPGSVQQRRSLIAAGAGAGVAAAFNAPIAGFIFIVEELLQDWSTATMATSLLATVTAATVARLLAGNIFMFQLPPTSFRLATIPWYLLLGLLAGLVGIAFIRGILIANDLYPRLTRVPKAWYPAIAGLITGAVGLVVPLALGGSHGLAEKAFHGNLALGALTLAFLAKFFLTVVAYGSGVPGGIFAPTLVLGACLGAGVGTVCSGFVGDAHATTAGLAFVGMGALFTAVARAPITAMLIVFEMTGNYEQVLPLMLACGAAHLTAHTLGGVSIYDALLHQAGITLDEAGPEELHHRMVGSMMTTALETFDATLPLHEAQRRLQASRHNGFPVCAGRRLLGMITESDILAATAGGVHADTPLSAIASRPVRTVAATDLLSDALALMTAHDIGRLVVVDPDQPTRPLGIITRSDVLRALRPRPAAAHS